MKIFLLAGSLNQGGAEFQILSLAKLFKEKGHDVEVFALTDHDFYMPFIETHDIKYSCLKNDQSKIKRIFLTAKKIRESKPDLVISYLKVVSQVAVVARLISMSGSKLIVGERTTLIKPWHDRFYFNLILLADHVMVNSIAKLNYLKKNYPLLRKRLSFIPNIIDINLFAPKANSTAAPNSNRLTFVGRISPEKNIVALVTATAKLIQEGYNLTLDLYGSTNNKSYSKQVAELIEQSEVGDKIKMRGQISNVKAVYGDADLLCLISEFEGFSNVLAESLASGIPILASDIEENRYLVEDAKNGFLVNPNNVDDISNGIRKFLNLDAIEREKIRLSNRQKAEEIFDKDKIYEEYITLYSKC